MNEYTKQARDFLKNANAKMTIKLQDTLANETWGDYAPRNLYKVIIKTPKGQMTTLFWDSLHNTTYGIKPNAYDVLSCLTKYDVGTIDGFVAEFGYEVNNWGDVKRIEKIYKGCKKEYRNICRIFTEEQIEALCEIA